MDSLLDELKKYAKDHDISQRDMAIKLGIPFKTVQPWFTEGKSRSTPSAASLEKIKQFLRPEQQPTLGGYEMHAEKNQTTSKVLDLGNDSKLKHGVGTRGKTIRDPIHMDIELNPLEISIIDTDDFQRLRHIKQLGTTSLVFPGAVHTRFEHSLGTVAAAQDMVNAINANPDNQLEIEPDSIKLIRLYALLHDVTHVPYGHTLEDEGFLYEKHDDPENNSRIDRFLGPSSHIGRILGEHLRNEVIKYLCTPRKLASTLERPYIKDIVGNTVCADLIDYLSRDTVYSGLKETFDPRFLRNLLIASWKNSPNENYRTNRLVLSLLKQDRLRRDVISEVMHLLRLRYSLAEKVYYHHAKIVASAMIIEAVQAALISKPSQFDMSALCEMAYGDDELLMKLRDSDVPISSKLASKLAARELYRPVFMLNYSEPNPEDTGSEKKAAIIESFKKNHQKRFELERNLEKWNNLPDGSVIIYCPTEDMNLKQIETLCLWREGKIMPLVDIPGGKIADEAKSINMAHMELWKLYVFMERGLDNEREIKQNLAMDCFNQFKLPNSLEDLSGEEKRLERYIEQWAETRPDLNITIIERKQLIGSRNINVGRNNTSPPSYNELEIDLKDIRGKHK